MKLLSIFYILSCPCWKWQCVGFCSGKLNAKKTRLYFYNIFDVYFNSNKLYNLHVDAVAIFVENFNLKQNGFKLLFGSIIRLFYAVFHLWGLYQKLPETLYEILKMYFERAKVSVYSFSLISDLFDACRSYLLKKTFHSMHFKSSWIKGNRPSPMYTYWFFINLMPIFTSEFKFNRYIYAKTWKCHKIEHLTTLTH